jgi:hypothetical protein
MRVFSSPQPLPFHHHHNMHIFSFFLFAISTLTLVTATPVIPLTTITNPRQASRNYDCLLAIESRQKASDSKPGSFRMCTEKQFAGECISVTHEIGQCWNIRKPFDSNVKSFRPDHWRGEERLQYSCSVYDEPGCMGGGESIKWPGSADLGRTISSVRCEYSNPEAIERWKKVFTIGRPKEEFLGHYPPRQR